jgi:hypothetical protein
MPESLRNPESVMNRIDEGLGTMEAAVRHLSIQSIESSCIETLLLEVATVSQCLAYSHRWEENSRSRHVARPTSMA